MEWRNEHTASCILTKCKISHDRQNCDYTTYMKLMCQGVVPFHRRVRQALRSNLIMEVELTL
mgnify:FL=1